MAVLDSTLDTRSERYNQYSFEISVLATKDDVRRAVEELFEVQVSKVRTQNRVGKARGFRGAIWTSAKGSSLFLGG